MNGGGGNTLDAAAVMFDLPNGRNVSRSMSRHQAFVGSKIKEITEREMKLALQMELEATIVHEESQEYYEKWIKESKTTRRKFGLTVSYDMGWQRRSSGNNYASLSGHAFLIGGHTRRVIGCVVFSKKCSICTKRGTPKTSSIITSSSSPSPPTTVSPPPQSPTTTATTTTPVDTTPATTTTPVDTILISTIQPTLPAVDVEDLGEEGTDEEDTTGSTGILDTSTIDHECTRNYDGSSGGMESDGLLLLMLKLDKDYEGEIFLEYVITDDDTKMRSYIDHHKTKPRGKKNIGGSLPSHIPVPNWYADPTHRAKCVAGSFFDLTKGPKSETRANKLDAFRMKKYYSYFIKQNRSKGLAWLVKHAMSPLDHMFDNHSLCHSSWCHKKRILEGGASCPSNETTRDIIVIKRPMLRCTK